MKLFKLGRQGYTGRALRIIYRILESQEMTHKWETIGDTVFIPRDIDIYLTDPDIRCNLFGLAVCDCGITHTKEDVKKALPKEKKPTISKYGTFNMEKYGDKICKGMNIKTMCLIMEISPNTYNNWRKRYPKFKKFIDECKSK